MGQDVVAQNLWDRTSVRQYPWGRTSWGRTSVAQDVLGQNFMGQEVSLVRGSGSGAGSRESYSIGPEFHVQNYNLNLTETTYSPPIPALAVFWRSMIRN